MFRNFLIRILFKLLDLGDVGNQSSKDGEKIHDWLIHCGDHPGFREYVRVRDLNLLRNFGNGLKDKTAESWRGQRLELLQLIKQVDNASKREKEKAKKQKEKIKKNKNK
jgi:hypothetical protein